MSITLSIKNMILSGNLVCIRDDGVKNSRTIADLICPGVDLVGTNHVADWASINLLLSMTN